MNGKFIHMQLHDALLSFVQWSRNFETLPADCAQVCYALQIDQAGLGSLKSGG